MRMVPATPSAWCCFALLASFAAVPAMAAVPTEFVDELVASPFDQPSAIAFLPDGRLLVAERATARLRIVKGTSIGPNDPVFVVDSVRTNGGEEGLLGLAIDPGWPARPYIYVHQTFSGGPFIRISRYTATGDLDGTGDGSLFVSTTSKRVLVADAPNVATNHNGGTVRFGTDGMLYVSLGDDAQSCQAQDLTKLAGKILRLDVSAVSALPGGPPPRALITPPDNPFVAHADSNARLVWAYGLRNPFSFQIDPANGDLFIADVGAAAWEEFDWANGAGMNFGWPLYEGTMRTTQNCAGVDTTGFVLPIATVSRNPGPGSIMAGPVYRRPAGAQVPFPYEYEGDVFYGEFYKQFLRRLKNTGGSWNPAPAPGQPNPTDWASGLPWVAAWAVGPEGALYYTNMWTAFPQPTGQVRRIAYVGTLDTPPSVAPALAFAAHPLPASGKVTLRFTLPVPAAASLAVHDAAGRVIRALLPPTRLEAGRHEVVWEGVDASGLGARPGLYFARLTMGSTTHVARIAWLR